jgi:hypothetical protein
VASYNKINQFVEDLNKKVHNMASDSLKWVLTNVAPVATNALYSDLTEISGGNGYTTGGIAPTITSATQSSGTLKEIIADLTITASGGSIGPFRYAVLVNTTPTSPLKPLVCWYDYGSSITLASGESFTIDLDNTNGLYQLA